MTDNGGGSEAEKERFHCTCMSDVYFFFGAVEWSWEGSVPTKLNRQWVVKERLHGVEAVLVHLSIVPMRMMNHCHDLHTYMGVRHDLSYMEKHVYSTLAKTSKKEKKDTQPNSPVHACTCRYIHHTKTYNHTKEVGP